MHSPESGPIKLATPEREPRPLRIARFINIIVAAYGAYGIEHDKVPIIELKAAHTELAEKLVDSGFSVSKEVVREICIQLDSIRNHFNLRGQEVRTKARGQILAIVDDLLPQEIEGALRAELLTLLEDIFDAEDEVRTTRD